MATFTNNNNGSWTLLVTPEEDDTMSALPVDQLAQYVTLWLAERGKSVLHDRFATLGTKDRDDVLTILTKTR